MEEAGFTNQFFVELEEQVEVVAKDIPNLVDVGMEIGFHDQLVESDMEIIEHLVVNDPVVVGGGLYVAEHLVVSNDTASVVCLECVDGDLHVVVDARFFATSVDSLFVDVDEDFLVKHYVQFVPGSEHAYWIVAILVFDRVM